MTKIRKKFAAVILVLLGVLVMTPALFADNAGPRPMIRARAQIRQNVPDGACVNIRARRLMRRNKMLRMRNRMQRRNIRRLRHTLRRANNVQYQAHHNPNSRG
jgi:hypothetical protein